MSKQTKGPGSEADMKASTASYWPYIQAFVAVPEKELARQVFQTL